MKFTGVIKDLSEANCMWDEKPEPGAEKSYDSLYEQWLEKCFASATVTPIWRISGHGVPLWKAHFYPALRESLEDWQCEFVLTASSEMSRQFV